MVLLAGRQFLASLIDKDPLILSLLGVRLDLSSIQR
jgi:hypothetical protein